MGIWGEGVSALPHASLCPESLAPGDSRSGAPLSRFSLFYFPCSILHSILWAGLVVQVLKASTSRTRGYTPPLKPVLRDVTRHVCQDMFPTLPGGLHVTAPKRGTSSPEALGLCGEEARPSRVSPGLPGRPWTCPTHRTQADRSGGDFTTPAPGSHPIGQAHNRSLPPASPQMPQNLGKAPTNAVHGPVTALLRPGLNPAPTSPAWEPGRQPTLFP